MRALARSRKRNRAGAHALRAGLAPLVIVMVATLSSGCFSWMKRTELKLDETVKTTRALQSRQNEIAAEVTQIRAILDSEGMVGDERRAELLTRLRTLEQSIARMDARIQEQEGLLRRISAAIDQLTRQSWQSQTPGGDPAAPGPGQTSAPASGASDSLGPDRSALPAAGESEPGLAGDLPAMSAGDGTIPYADSMGGEWVPVSGADGEWIPVDSTGGQWVPIDSAGRAQMPAGGEADPWASADSAGGEWVPTRGAEGESLPAGGMGDEGMSAAGSGADTGDGSPELLIYDAAVRDFARGSYTMARSGFEEMLRRFPRSQLADNAAFWLAETLYAEGQFQQSLARFEQLLRDYPWTDVRLSALLKSGYCHLELGDTNGAAKAFRRIMLEDPGSDEAAIAEHKLEAMGESGTAEGPRE